MSTARTQPDQREIDSVRGTLDAISQAFAAKIVGQRDLRESLLIGLLAGGHILIESVPGLAKTTAARVHRRVHSGRLPGASSARPTCCPATSSAPRSTTRRPTRSSPNWARCTPTSCCSTRSTGPAPRRRARCSRRWRNGRPPSPGSVLPDSGAVPGDRHPEPRRPGRHLSAVRGADRPLHAQGRRALPLPARRGGGDVADGRRHVRQGATALRRWSSLDDMLRAPGRGAPRPHGPRADALRQPTRRRDPPPRAAPARAARAADRVRRQPTRHHRVLQGGAGAGGAVRACARLPDDIAKLAHRVLRHRLILGFEAASAGITPEVVVDAVLQAVRVP